MARYAENTSVSSDKSRAEIERTLERYGADAFLYGWEGARAIIRFRMHDRQIAFALDMPDRNDDEFWQTPSGRKRRDEAAAYQAWEQACRQRWRALALVVKAKLEAVESGISSFQEEFLAWTVLPNGETAGAFMLPQVAIAYESGKMPPLLLPAGKP